MNDILPSTNGRGADGKFIKGWKGGPGNPQIKRVQQWKRALRRALTRERMEKIWEVLVKKAMEAEPWAIHEVFDRAYGKPSQPVEVDGELVHLVAIKLEFDRPPGAGE